MVEFVSVDHSVADQGDRYFLVGVAVEVDNGSDFDRYYFDLVNQFCDRYNIELAHDIIKSRDVLNRLLVTILVKLVRQLLRGSHKILQSDVFIFVLDGIQKMSIFVGKEERCPE